MICFAMNTAKCDTASHTAAAYPQFGREFMAMDDINHDLRPLIDNNIVTKITPYLKEFVRLTPQIKERVEQRQDKRKEYFDKKYR